MLWCNLSKLADKMVKKNPREFQQHYSVTEYCHAFHSKIKRKFDPHILNLT